MTGPATAKLLIPSVVVVLGTDSNPVQADPRYLLPAIAEIARQSSAKYVNDYATRYAIARHYLDLVDIDE